MGYVNPLAGLPVAHWFDSLLPDFVLAFTFFTALTYAVLGRRFGQQRPAIAMAVALGLSLSVGLVWWEYATDRSIRDLGPIAVGFALIVLGFTLYHAVRILGGNWAGAGIAFGVCLILGWALGVIQSVDGWIIQVLILVTLLGGILAYVGHRTGRQWRPMPPPAERAAVWHDMRDLEQDRRTADQLWDRLSWLRRETDWLERRPDLAGDAVAQIRRLLPAEGWLTDRLAELRAKSHLMRAGHLARIQELREMIGRLPPPARRQAATELADRYAELKLDVRLERLDRAVALSEGRIRQLTRQAEAAITAHEYEKVRTLLDEAVRLQGQNARLIRIIERTEARLLALARSVIKNTPEVSAG